MTPEFPVPSGVPTSVTLPELKLLQKYAAGRRVLEIGTHFGFTCIGMALARAHVTSVDPHYEGPADRPDTWEPFLANCRRHGFNPGSLADAAHHIIASRATIESLEPFLPLRFDLVFIDGDHVWPYPLRDAGIAFAHLGEPGLIAYHDVTPNWPGVWRATQELCESGKLRRLEQVGTMAVYQVEGGG